MVQREELEAKIKEMRLAEATKKGLMGPSGKIGTVLRSLGSPIVSQTEGASYIDLGGDLESEGIPVMDVEGSQRPEGPEWSDSGAIPVPYGIHEIGRQFDGLARGMHLELIYKDESSETSVYYRGHLVYRESQGELQCYVPLEEWEDWVSSLFKIAKKKQREDKESEFQARMERADREKTSWLRELASKWGMLGGPK